MATGVRELDDTGAKAALEAGEVILFPTETFYALGCDALNPDAVGKLFSLKKRPLSLPLPVVIGSPDMLDGLARGITELDRALMEAFWPGPLSVVLPANKSVPDLLTANMGRVAVRISPHPAVLALCRITGRVLVASSANVSGDPPAARPEELPDVLLDGVAGVFSLGPEPEGGLPSTIVDTRQQAGKGKDGPKGTVRILRQGAVSIDAILDKGFSVLDASAGDCA